MNDEPIRVLLVEDNPGDARLVREAFLETGATQFHLVDADRIGEALTRLGEDTFDVVLLDLSLPDSHGIETYVQVNRQCPEVPIVVLTGAADESQGVEAVQQGAQDYLVKGQVSGNLLVRSIRYAIERHRKQAELRSLSIVDELTGLYNRRGFNDLAECQLKIAARTKTAQVLLFCDVDGLKQINDLSGHHAGDLALIETAECLKEVFRDSDIVARIGGDEFAVLATNTRAGSAETLASRLQENVEAHNTRQSRSYSLSISVGTACIGPECGCSVDELLAQADASMYEQKRRKSRS